MAGLLGRLVSYPKFQRFLNRLIRIYGCMAAWFRQPVISAKYRLPLHLIRIDYQTVCFLHLIPMKVSKISSGSWELKQLTGIRKVLVTLLHVCMTLRAFYGTRVLLLNDLRIAINGALIFDGVLISVVCLLGGMACIIILTLYVNGQEATELFNFGNQISQEIAG